MSSEFEKNFAPIVTSLEGFEAYVGAAPAYDDEFNSGEDLAFFFNVFRTDAEALSAQAGAAVFYDQNIALNENIESIQFSTGYIRFHQKAPGVCSGASLSDGGGFLYFRTYETNSQDESQMLTKAVEKGLAPKISSLMGFKMYLGGELDPVDERQGTFFIGVFETKDQVDAALTVAGEWVTGSAYADLFSTTRTRSIDAEISFAEFCEELPRFNSYSYSYSLSFSAS